MNKEGVNYAVLSAKNLMNDQNVYKNFLLLNKIIYKILNLYFRI